MKLDVEQIKKIATGAVRIEEENEEIRLYRFTKEQEELYVNVKQDLNMKRHATSGIKLSFSTNSKNLFIKINTEQGSSRKYFSVDVFVDEKCIGYIDNFSNLKLPVDYTKMELPLGEFSKNFYLGEGEKKVCVHMPWSTKTFIKEIAIDDGAFIEEVIPPKKLLAFGDSITQGYDALRPSNRYIAKLADKLDAEEFNKAIGGEVFFPELAMLKDQFVPDYITVAYGTNDWSKTDREIFKKNCKAFYASISQNYPDTKIFAITPIWRKDMCEERVFGDFNKVEEDIRDIVKDIENVTVIRGFDFVPKDEGYYADLRLHPNDEGFEYYVKSLYDKINV